MNFLSRLGCCKSAKHTRTQHARTHAHEKILSKHRTSHIRVSLHITHKRGRRRSSKTLCLNRFCREHCGLRAQHNSPQYSEHDKSTSAIQTQRTFLHTEHRSVVAVVTASSTLFALFAAETNNYALCAFNARFHHVSRAPPTPSPPIPLLWLPRGSQEIHFVCRTKARDTRSPRPSFEHPLTGKWK